MSSQKPYLQIIQIVVADNFLQIADCHLLSLFFSKPSLINADFYPIID